MWLRNILTSFDDFAGSELLTPRELHNYVGNACQSRRPEHPALREALVNTLIHADYDSRTHIVVRQTSDEIMFRNGGTLRLPAEVAMAGGNSDCRNKNLQKMFQLVGYGEKLGSGFPKIREAWREKGWATPRLEERIDVDNVDLHLRFAPEMSGSESLFTDQPTNLPTKLPALTDHQHHVLELCVDETRSLKDIMEQLNLRARRHVVLEIMQPLLDGLLLVPTHPENPHHPRQAYRTTEAGRAAVSA